MKYEDEKKSANMGAGSTISAYVTNIFTEFKTSRLPWEEIWIECWRNWLGEYDPRLTMQKSEGRDWRSKIFVKLTTLKCNTAHSKIIDVLFRGNSVPFDIEAHLHDLYEQMGLSPEMLTDIVSFWKGKLKDYLGYIDYAEVLDPATLEMCILGTGVIKGPIIEVRKNQTPRLRMINGMPINSIDKNSDPFEFVQSEEIVPVFDHVPLWEYYCDPNARNQRDSIGEIHFQRWLPAEFRKLAYQGGYRSDKVLEAAIHATSTHPDDKKFEQLSDNYMGVYPDKDRRVSVLEYQGQVPAGMLRAEGETIPADIEDEETVEALVVLGADSIPIKNKYNPSGKRSFHVCPYKKRPNCIFGIGPAEMMRGSQKMVNSSTRLYIDNKNLSGNLMTAVNMDKINTKLTQNGAQVYPGKRWVVKGSFKPKEAIDAVVLPDITMGLKDMIELFERFADEETGLPKYTQGEQGSFLNKTATGMSMLMGQSNLNIKTCLKNIDNCWIEDSVEALFHWLLEFDETIPQQYRIPLKIKATGTDSVIAKEIRLEQYMKFMQVIMSNPQTAIFVDTPKMTQIMADLMETEDIMRTKEEIAQIMKEMSDQANSEKDWKEFVDIDRLYPFLQRSEQMQVLEMLGIKPGNEIAGAVPPSPGVPGASPSVPALPPQEESE